MCVQFYRAITHDVTEEYLATGEYVDDILGEKKQFTCSMCSVIQIVCLFTAILLSMYIMES